jgi:hypothetical protein
MKALRRFLVVLAAVVLPLASQAQEAKPSPITAYGVVHLGAFFDGGSFKSQEVAWTGLQTNNGGSVFFSARQSRFGLRFNGGSDNLLGADLTGAIEVDFLGGYPNGSTSALNNYKPVPRLRIASVKATWKSGDNSFSLLAGNDWPVLLNVGAESVAYMGNPMFSNSGNIYTRDAQIQLAWAGAFGDIGVGVQAALVDPTSLDGSSNDNSNANIARAPRYQVHANVGLKGDIGGTIGVGYEMQKRRFNYLTATQKDVTTSLIGVEANLSLTKFVGLKGEYFSSNGEEDSWAGLAGAGATGSNLTNSATAFGNIKSTGYWAQVILKPVDEFWVTAGTGQEKLDEASVLASISATPATALATNANTKNSTTEVGFILYFSKMWRAGLEYVMTESDYPGATGATPSKVKIQQVALSTQFKF